MVTKSSINDKREPLFCSKSARIGWDRSSSFGRGSVDGMGERQTFGEKSPLFSPSFSLFPLHHQHATMNETFTLTTESVQKFIDVKCLKDTNNKQDESDEDNE